MFSYVQVFRSLSDRSKLLIAILVGSIALAVIVCVATTAYDDSQTRVLYSLDARQNDQEIVKLIDAAHRYAYFAVYTFTQDDIADALIRAKKRGVIVWGITDRDQAASAFQAPLVARLQKAGIPVETQKHLDGIMHVKALVTENAYASGSYNWTESATVANDEILEIGTNPYVHRYYFEIVKKILLANR
jgi:phosphatidylserine/phosphatidylglycerophosphate/cardiolipin synthase-like enzyme